jgi:hypothetical protein
VDLEAIKREIAEVRGLIADLIGKLQTVDGWLAKLAGLLGE